MRQPPAARPLSIAPRADEEFARVDETPIAGGYRDRSRTVDSTPA